MATAFIAFFSHFPPRLAVFFISMIPVLEIRGALPIAIISFHLPVWQALILTIVGNMVPITIILFAADRFHRWVSTHAGFLGRNWVKYLDHLQEKFSHKYQKYGLVILMLLAAGLPVPIIGGYTAAAAAFVFGVPINKSWPYLFAGVVLSGLVTAAITVGVARVF